MKLNNFESALVYYSKGWFEKKTEHDKEMWLKRIWTTTYIINNRWSPDYFTTRVLVPLLLKIAPTQPAFFFRQEEFILKLLADMSPGRYFDSDYSITDSKSYWTKVVDSLFNFLSQIQVKSGKNEWDQMPEEIERPEFEEILDWINDHKYVKDFDEMLEVSE